MTEEIELECNSNAFIYTLKFHGCEPFFMAVDYRKWEKPVLSQKYRLHYILFNLGDCPHQKMDIAILADVSRSMKMDHRNKTLQLIDRLIDKLGVSSEGTHYGFISFNRFATLHNTFEDPMYHNENNLKTKMREEIMNFPEKWGTRTDLAFNLAATQLFTPVSGDRPDAKNVMLVFTDGKPKQLRIDHQPIVYFSKSTKALEVSQSWTLRSCS